MFSTLDDWFFHIKQIHLKRMDLGLDRIGLVADRLQLRYFSCPVITVGGTNGKGSCTKTLESIYTGSGYKTGLYTSPHLMEFNERIRIHNQNSADDDLMRAFEVIEKARAEIILSFFEFTTLAALWLFQQAQCDVLILEVGLGGRLDAVNIVESDVAIVTSIALDHTDWLGNTRDEIAYEKACIARENKLFICGDDNPPQTLFETVSAKKAILHLYQRDYFFDEKLFPKPHLKPQNVATAINAVMWLQKQLPVTQNQIAAGIRDTILPGRFEVVSSPFPCILDVAHNPQAATWLAKQVGALAFPKKIIAIVGMLKDKAMIETIKPLLPLIDTWCVCSLLSENEERGSDGIAIAEYLKTNENKKCYHFVSVADAMVFASREQCDCVLVFGSFYTVAEAKRWMAK